MIADMPGRKLHIMEKNNHASNLLRGSLPDAAAAKGIWSGLRHIALHCHQHLREHHLESLQPLHGQQRARG